MSQSLKVTAIQQVDFPSLDLVIEPGKETDLGQFSEEVQEQILANPYVKKVGGSDTTPYRGKAEKKAESTEE